MILHDSDSVAQNDKPPTAVGSDRGNVTEQTALECNAWDRTTPDLHPQCRNARGVPECYQQFVADRQRMLRSWVAIQHLPIAELHQELHATTNAMRQLIQLGACHEPEA